MFEGGDGIADHGVASGSLSHAEGGFFQMSRDSVHTAFRLSTEAAALNDGPQHP